MAPGNPRTARMGGPHRVREHRGSLVVARGIQRVFVARVECPLLLLLELARVDFELAPAEPWAMLQCDQPGAALVNKAELLGDPDPDPAPRARRGRRYPGLRRLGLLGALARTAAHVEVGHPFQPAPFE
jgi:hypothetical protein